MRSRLLSALALLTLLATGSAQAADVLVPVPGFPLPAPAKVTITVPDDAIILFNGVAAVSGGKTRAYLTPPLLAGQPYMYEVTAVVVRGHQLMTATERLVVWSGEEVKVSFQLPPAPGKK